METLPFKQKYLKAVLALNELSVKQSEYIGKSVSPKWHDDLSKITQKYTDKKGAFLLWFSGSRLIGMGGILRINAGTAFIKRVRVHPHYQRKGLSAKILAALEKKAIALGYKKLVANTAKGNIPAEKMLLNASFRPTGEKEFFCVPCTLFEKKLKSTQPQNDRGCAD